MPAPKMLMILSSHSSMVVDGKDRPTGWFLPEFAHPYNVFKAHYDITVASPAGGPAPLDPWSIEFAAADAAAQDFYRTQQALWADTTPLAALAGRADEFAGLFVVGGHGPMFDLPVDAATQAVVRAFWAAGKVVAAVCHGPAALTNVRLDDGAYLVAGAAVTGFTDAEEEAVGLTAAVPFLLEDRLKERGAQFEAAEPWGVKVVVGKEGRLITGQNPQSASAIAEAVVEVIAKA